MIRGGESEEPAIIPGRPDESPFFQAVMWDGIEMPPKENDRLTDHQIQAVKRWIATGAPWPSGPEQDEILKAATGVQENEDGVLVSTSGGLADAWTYRRYSKEEVWAFGPLQQEFDYQSVDGFVNAKLRDANIQPAPQASPEQLIRRATFDLTGLPPTPRALNRFLGSWKKDPKNAWGDLIDRLLESPHFGERWGQHWLDVVRYADTAGFSNDYERSNAWRYRDYVIRAFNDDKPYDQFVLEQIAGDELRPDDPEAIVATGFLRMGPWGTAMIPPEEARQLFRDDVVHGIGQSFLSIPMRCCKCHDHKFDPIPTRDYYRIYAALSATQPAEIPAEFLPEENRNRFEEGLQLVQTLYAFANSKREALVEKRETAARKWYDRHNLPYKDGDERKKDPEDKKPPRHIGLDEIEKGRLKVREQDCWIWERRKERYQPLAQSVFNGPNQSPNGRKLRKPEKLNKDWRPKSFIHAGGDYKAQGEVVTPGVLSGCGVPVEGAPTHDPFALTTDIRGRRLGLAKWIADPRNPLTPRTYVNRLWQHHFGQGIVRTANPGDTEPALDLRLPRSRTSRSVPGSDESAQSERGLGDKATQAFGRQCLMARKLVEQGVRFVQIFSGGWDSHDYLERGHWSRIASVDKPIAALIKDLRRRGLLDETLVIWTGEFGRTPDNNYRGGVTSLGRGHNVDAMNLWLAGGGTKKGTIVGATDEIGAEAVECVHPIRDLHVTLLHLLGLDDNKLTYFHGGRYKQLSQFGGEVIQELIA